MRPLLWTVTALVLLRFAGVIEFPDGWFVAAIVIEVGFIVFEVIVIVSVIRFFYRRRRASGHTRPESLLFAEVDEMRATGVPERVAEKFERIVLWELVFYRRWGARFRKWFGRG